MKKVKIYLFCKDRLVEWEINRFQDSMVEFVLDKSITMFSRDYNIRFEFENGHYKLKSSYDMIVTYKDQNINCRTIYDGDVLICNFPHENSKIILLIQFEDEISHVFGKFSLMGFDNIKIGKGKNNNIVYDNSNVSDFHVVLQLGENPTVEIVEGTLGCYLNQVRVSKSSIKFGDVIFLYGLKCVYLGNCIAVNNPNKNVYLNLRVIEKNEIDTLLPRKFTNFKASSTDIGRHLMDMGEEKNITVNPPYIDFKIKFKFLYFGILPIIIVTSSVLLFIGVMFVDLSSIIYLGSCGLLISIFILIYGIVSNKSEIKRNIKNYKLYLDGKSKKLTLIRDEKVKALSRRYPKVTDCYRGVINFDKKIWNRNIADKDFLNLTIGQGNLYFENLNVNSNVISNLSKEHELYKEYVEITSNFRIIRKAPITIPLRDINRIAIVGDMSTLYDVVKDFLVQLTALHSYRDLKIGILNPKQYDEELNYVKEIPHVYSDDKDFRYISSGDNEMVDLIYNIKRIVSERESMLSQDSNRKFNTEYVIFIFYDFNPILDSFLDYMKNVDSKIGISFILVTIHDRVVPDSFKYILNISEDTQTLYKVQESGIKKLVLSHEYADISNLIDVDKYVNELSKIKIFDNFEEIKKFEDKSMFNMYSISRTDELDIMSRWDNNSLLNLRDIPVGVKYNRSIFSVNMHAKHNGPNGIILGDSSTGKTEFLRTFILSYCINFHPNNFNFIVIKSNHNTKLNSFINMPHVIDILDKESESELSRFVLLIKNEINKRQILFDSVKVRDINGYLNVYKNYDDLCILPYITIVIDDVRSSDLDLIKELTSLRDHMSTVGIYLLIATNDSSAFVDDSGFLLSKFDFRICFRLSNLKHMFALLEDSNVSNPRGSGIFNVKFSNLSVVKNVEVAFSNVEQDIENSNENLDIINNCGLIIKKISRVRYLNNSKIQYLAVIDKINELCDNIEVNVTSIFNSSLRYLNLQQLPGYSSNFNGFMWCESKNKCSAIIGIIDDPKYHLQRFLEVNFENLGNLFVYGSPGTGKSTLIKTLIYSLCCEYKPSYLNIYIVDANTRNMDCFSYAPHVKDMAYTKDEINALFKKVLDEFDLRRKIFENLDISSIENYKIKTGEQLPHILLVIDSIQDISNSVWDYSNFIKMLARDGKSYGIFVCAVSPEYDDVEEKLSEYFNNKFVLRLNNKNLYKKILGEDCVVSSKLKGRGLICYNDNRGSRILEFQIAVPMETQNNVDLNNRLKYLFMQMRDINNKIYESSYIGKMLDEDVNYNEIRDENHNYLNESKRISLSQFISGGTRIPKLTIITYDSIDNNKRIIKKFLEIFNSSNFKSYMLGDTSSNFKGEKFYWYSGVREEISQTINWITDISLKRIEDKEFDLRNEEKLCIFISNLDNSFLEESINKIVQNVVECENDIGVYFFVSLDDNNYSQYKLLDILNSNPQNGLIITSNDKDNLDENFVAMYKSEKVPVMID